MRRSRLQLVFCFYGSSYHNSIEPCGENEVYVDDQRVTSTTALNTGSIIRFGQNHVFRFVNPKEARQLR